MRANMSPLDSDIRGLVLAPVALLTAVGLGVDTAVGLFVLVTAIALWITACTGYCPVYHLFGARESKPN